MVLNNIFTLDWQARYGKIIEDRAMPAVIEVFKPGARVYNPATDSWSDSETVLYGPGTPDAEADGRARVQPLRTSRREAVPGNTTSSLTVLFSIPYRYNTVDLRPDLQVRILDAPLNPSLLTYQYVVYEVVDSANIIERTFYATVDQEVVV